MVWLHKAITAGYNNMLELSASPVLNILCDRADFNLLLADIDKEQAKAEPER
jgi:hypothetical protein